MSEQALLSELRKISRQLAPEDSYFDRDQHSLGSIVSLPTATLLSGALEEYTQYVITTDGDIRTITYQVQPKTGAGYGPEIEAKDLSYIPGPVRNIKFGNDTAQSGKNINLIKYHTSRLAPPMVPPSPPGTTSQIVDPHITPGLSSSKFQIAYEHAVRLGGSKPIVLVSPGITTTNQYDTLQVPIGTAFTVTTDKILIIFAGVAKTSAAAKGVGLGYADDAIQNSATDGTNPVRIYQGAEWENATANQTFDLLNVYAEIPAGKLPRIETESTSGTIVVAFLGVEVDA